MQGRGGGAWEVGHLTIFLFIRNSSSGVKFEPTTSCNATLTGIHDIPKYLQRRKQQSKWLIFSLDINSPAWTGSPHLWHKKDHTPGLQIRTSKISQQSALGKCSVPARRFLQASVRACGNGFILNLLTAKAHDGTQEYSHAEYETEYGLTKALQP